MPVEFLFEQVCNNMVSCDDTTIWLVAMTVQRKVHRQLSLIEESYINKESEKQLKSRYDQFISSEYVDVSRFKCHIYCWG